MSITSPDFWIALLQIIGVNIVLSGDNAVVIALAARGLPAKQQAQAVAWGSGAAVVMRIVMGTRGLGTHTGALLGSVAHGTAEQGGVPMLLVK